MRWISKCSFINVHVLAISITYLMLLYNLEALTMFYQSFIITAQYTLAMLYK